MKDQDKFIAIAPIYNQNWQGITHFHPWKWLQHWLLKFQSLSTTVLFGTTLAGPIIFHAHLYSWHGSWSQTINSPSCHYPKYHSLLSWVLRKIYCGSLSFQGTHYLYYIIFGCTSPKAWYQDPLHLIPDKSIVTISYYLLWLKISKYLIFLSMIWIGCELVPKVLTFHALPAAILLLLKYKEKDQHTFILCFLEHDH